MSEEEIISNIKRIIGEFELARIDGLTFNEEYVEAIIGILNLYQKEKIVAENHKMAFKKQTEILQELDKELDAYKIYTLQADVSKLDYFIKQKYISKDKVEVKITELDCIIEDVVEHYKNTYENEIDYINANFAKEYLLELLEE